MPGRCGFFMRGLAPGEAAPGTRDETPLRQTRRILPGTALEMSVNCRLSLRESSATFAERKATIDRHFQGRPWKNSARLPQRSFIASPRRSFARC